MATALFVMIVILLALMVIGVPIGFTFSLSGIVGGSMANIPLGIISSSTFYALASFPLLAIPLFILAGELMNRGKLIDRLIDVSELFLFWLPGKLGHVSIVSCAFLGAMTGSSVATVAAISGSMGEKLVEHGYDRAYVASLAAASGLLGVLIPPAIPLIVFGASVGVSVSELFLATIIPGVMMTVAYMILHLILLPKTLSKDEVGNNERSRRLKRETDRSKRSIMFSSLPAVIMPVIILGGIYSGITTATEAAGIAGFYALFVILGLRLIGFKQIPDIFMTAAKTAGSILVIIGFTSVFNKMMTLMQVPQMIAEFMLGLTDNKYIFLICINLLLFLVGMFMESNAAVMLMSPLLFPSAVAMGVDPVHFGIILVTNIEIGLITPPMAANIYVAAKINRSSLVEMWPYTSKFIVVAVIVLIIITYVPVCTLWWR